MVNNESIVYGDYSLFTDIGDVEISNKSLKMNLSKKFSTVNALFAVSYENHSRRFKDIFEGQLFNSFKTSYLVGFSAAFKKTYEDNWTAGWTFAPQLNSTFQSAANGDDLILAGNIQIGKSWNPSILYRKAEIIFGLHYDTLFGAPQLYPLVAYSNWINQSWSYTIGFPHSNLNYSLNNNQNISFLIHSESNFTNNSAEISINGTDTFLNSKLESRSLAISLNYDSILGDYWIAGFGISYLPITELRILDTFNNQLYQFDGSESLGINFRVKYKLNKMK
tara:strand:- start:13692 stop:14528 length:837 start_codon:yes stop_codon:yes gene_type:complete